MAGITDRALPMRCRLRLAGGVQVYIQTRTNFLDSLIPLIHTTKLDKSTFDYRLPPIACHPFTPYYHDGQVDPSSRHALLIQDTL
jgi:hypothetical protein